MKYLPSSLAVLCLLAAGCGTSPITFPSAATAAKNAATTCDATAPAGQTNSQFSIQPSVSSLSLYPGQTTTVSVAVTSLDGAPHQVQFAASHLPQGLTVTSTPAATGGTATLTFQAAPNLAFNCFNGTVYVFSAQIPIAVTASSSSVQATTPIALTVVLEDPAFTPAKTDLPVLQLTTTDSTATITKDDYIPGSVKLTDPANSGNNFKQTMQIEGHGNSTWQMPKKPYNLKLDSKEAVLGMGSAKHWILLANYDDKTLLRNALAFHISQMLMSWTPNSRFVELYLNGNYEGVYQITEKVEIDPNRLNITEMDDTDNSGVALTGGYLLEFDAGRSATFSFLTPRNLPIDSDDPDPPTSQQQTYITSVVANAENALFASNSTNSTTGWPAHLDRDSFVDWFIVEELMGNPDSYFGEANSVYMYKQRGDPLLYIGPVWDFDMTAGNSFITPSEPYLSHTGLWYAKLFQDPAFVAAVKARWTQIRPQIDNLPSFIDTNAAALAQGQQNNFQRWPILYDLVWPNVVAYGTYPQEVNYLKTWMADRVAFMDKNYLVQ